MRHGKRVGREMLDEHGGEASVEMLDGLRR
jgi:hypothetical protein